MRSTYMTSAIIAVAVLIWLSSGLLREPRPELPQTIIERNNMVSSQQSDRAPTRVRARVIHAKDTNRTITIRGQTQNKRTVVTRAQVPGTLMSRPKRTDCFLVLFRPGQSFDSVAFPRTS